MTVELIFQKIIKCSLLSLFLLLPFQTRSGEIAAGMFHTCAISNGGTTAWCWGKDNDWDGAVGSRLNNPPLSGHYSLISSGGYHSCIKTGTVVRCWGDNKFKQTTVPSINGAIQITSGLYHSCALTSTIVKCWGRNDFKQIVVPVLNNPTKIASGSNHNCAIVNGGDVVCWGDNRYHQTEIPAYIHDAIAITAGDRHTCILRGTDRSVKCFGFRGEGQLNVPINDLSNVIDISAGKDFTCALQSVLNEEDVEVGQKIKCWGYNLHNELRAPNIDGTVTTWSTGGYHSCLIDSSGPKCWGYNNYGQAEAPEDGL